MANAGQGKQLVALPGEVPAVLLHHLARSSVKGEGPAVVAHPLPGGQHVGIVGGG